MIIAIIITSIILIISITFFIFQRESEAYVKINFIDFNENNFYDKVSLTLEKNKKPKITKITKKYIIFNIFGFKNKEILCSEINIINSTLKISKSFKIKIYKNCTNIINIEINNKNLIYYNSEIIFYCGDSATNINIDNLEYCSHNLKNRKRLIICNFNEVKLSKILKNNSNNNIDLQNKALKIIKSNYNQLLLINIYITKNKTNILIFKDEEEEKSLIIPTYEEKKFFENFYLEIYNNMHNINNLIKICQNYKKKLIFKKKIFNINISNLDDEDNINIYFSFINQGIDFLLENEIIKKDSLSDYYFILGYMLFYAYIYKKTLESTYVEKFFENMQKAIKRKYPFIDLLKIGVSYITFSINEIFTSLNLNFTNELGKNSPYYNGFNFFKDIILDLNEDSDLLFIYLQINSGCGLDLIKKEKCFKLSMISVDDIKSHIIQNIPKYFYTYFSNEGKYFYTDSITQVMIFNDSKIFDYISKNAEKNDIMNVAIGMFHESDNFKYQIHTDIDGIGSSINSINKKLEIIKKFPNNNEYMGEKVNFIDYFLFNSKNDLIVIDLICSLRSYELMDKNYFIRNLTFLNIKANDIVTKNQENNIEKGNERKDKNNNQLQIISDLSEFERSFINDPEFKRLEEIGCDIDY